MNLMISTAIVDALLITSAVKNSHQEYIKESFVQGTVVAWTDHSEDIAPLPPKARDTSKIVH